MNRLADTAVCPATTNVSTHSFVDLRILRRAFAAEQGRGAHHLTTLAISALRNAHLDPGLLHLFAHGILGDRFDRRDLSSFSSADRGYAGSDRLPIHMHRAGSAQTHATAKFSSSKSQDIAYCPQQGHIIRGVQAMLFAIKSNRSHRAKWFFGSGYTCSA